MKKLYSAENRLLVFHIKNLLEAEGVGTQVKNEFAGGGVGDIAPLDTWLELWIADDEFKAAKIKLNSIVEAIENTQEEQLKCASCDEICDAHFKICWNCGSSLETSE